MSENPFRKAAQRDNEPGIYAPPDKPFFYDQNVAAALAIRAQGMTRQQLLEEGLLPVSEMDDEELRVGRCRDSRGRLVTGEARTKMLPRDIYDAMIAEHFVRTKEKLRGQLDRSYETLVDIRDDDSVEPETRAKIAMQLVERIEGKTPDRVQMTVAKAPWEEVGAAGIARITKAESERLRGIGTGEIHDAEIVDEANPASAGPAVDNGGRSGDAPEPPSPAGTGRSQRPRGPRAGGSPSATPEYESNQTVSGEIWSAADESGRTDGSASGAPLDEAQVRPPDRDAEPDYRSPVEELGILDADLIGDPRITPPIPVPSATAPQSTNPQAPPTKPLSEVIRDHVEGAAEIAERRKAAREKIEKAKRQRKINRALGKDSAPKITLSGFQAKMAESLRLPNKPTGDVG